MGSNINPRVLILIGLAFVIAVLGAWRLCGSGEPAGGPEGDGAALQMMRKLADNEDHEGMVKAAGSKDLKSARRSVRAMGRVGYKAILGIKAAMKDPRPEVRQEAMIAVSQAGTEKELPDVVTVALEDKSPAVRADACLALGRMKAYTKIDTLLAAMGDEDANVRRRANKAIVKIIGAGVSFNPKASVEKRTKAIDKMRALWLSMKAKTEQFYQNRKRYRQNNPAK
jgi:HEAT repeat protein